MLLVHNERVEAFLPKMTLPTVLLVDLQRIARMRFAQKPRKRVSAARNQNQMHVIRHQAVRQYVYFGCGQLLRKQVKIGFVVGITEEYRLSPIASLRDMMRVVGHYQPWKPRHCKVLLLVQ